MRESSFFIKKLHQRFNKVFWSEELEKYRLTAYINYINDTSIIGSYENIDVFPLKKLLLLKDFIKQNAPFIVISTMIRKGNKYICYIVSYCGILEKELDFFCMEGNVFVTIYLDTTSIDYLGEEVYITAHQIAGQLYYVIKEKVLPNKCITLLNVNNNKITVAQKIDINELLHLLSMEIR